MNKNAIYGRFCNIKYAKGKILVVKMLDFQKVYYKMFALIFKKYQMAIAYLMIYNPWFKR